MKGREMQFQLTISLDNAEAVAEYLATLSETVGNGYRDGTVRDGNGNTIGQWKITGQG